MGALKITAEGLIIVGRIMKADGVEESIKGFGKDLLVKYAPSSFKWFRTEARAADALSSEVENAISDQGLRNLVQQTVSRYPEVLGQIATKGEGIPSPSGDISLRLVPRYLVNEEALREIEKPLDSAARLQQLKGGPEARQVFFRQLVNEADDAYKSSNVSVSSPLKAGYKRMIVHYDPDFNWKPPEREEKYMGAYVVYWNDEETLKKNRKDVKQKLDRFITELAALSQEEIQAMRGKISAPAEYSF